MRAAGLLRWSVAIAFLVVAPLSVAATSVAPQAVKEIKVDMSEFAFQPKDLTVTAGERVRVVVTNVGAVPHEWEVSKLGAENVKWATEADVPAEERTSLDEHATRGTPEIWLPAKATGTVEFTAVTPGTYVIKCGIEGHFEAGMVGTFTVSAAAAAAPAPVAPAPVQLPATGRDGPPLGIVALGILALALVVLGIRRLAPYRRR